jgi:Bacterial PH domain
MVYQSKKDLWLVVVMLLGCSVVLIAGLLVLVSGTAGTQGIGWLLVGVGVANGALIRWLSSPLYYEIGNSEIGNSHLFVRCGPFRWNIPLANIVRVQPTRNPLSSPAMSLDRLQVDYQEQGARKSLMISPQDQSGFLRELGATASHLRVSGDELVSKSI